MDARSGGGRFVGRAGELARLEASLRDALAGRATATLLAGEAGVGKSRLVAELEAIAVGQGMRVVEGSCLPHGEAGPPFLPIVSILRSIAREVPPAALPAIIGPGRADLARLVPELAERTDRVPTTGETSDPTAQARLFELVAGAIDRLGRAGPLLLVVEDLHWADRSSRELLDFLIRGLRDQRLLVLLTVRTDDLASNDDLQVWAAEVVRLPRVERLDLGPLDRASVAALVGDALGHAPEPRLVADLSERANGNPFLVEELIATAGMDASGAMPVHLRELLLARLVGLGDPAREVVRAASAMGSKVDDGLLADALDIPDPMLAGALHEAHGRGVLVRTGEADGAGYAFRHALLREAVYADLLPRERAHLHARYGAALARRLERDPASVAPAALAYHWDAAGMLAPALDAHIRAALEARRMFAFAEARAHLERALELWPRVVDPEAVTGVPLAEVLERASAAAALEGDYAAGVTHLTRAIDLVDARIEPARLGSLREQQRFLLWEAGDEAAAALAVQEALRLVPAQPPSAERARVLAHAAGLDLLGGRPLEALAGAMRAIRVARAATALPEEALALGVKGFAEATLGHTDEGVAAFREGMAIARLVGSVDGLALGYTNLVSLLDRVGRTRDALATALEGYDEVAASGLARTFGGHLLAQAGRMHLHLGGWAEAEELLRRGLDLGPVPSGRLALLIEVARLAAARGEVPVADEALATALELRDAPGASASHARLLEARLEVAAWADRLVDARRAVDDAMAIPTAGRPPDPVVASLATLGVRVEADAAELARARHDDVALGRAEMRGAAIVDWVRGSLPAGDLETQAAMARSIDERGAAIVAILRAETDRIGGGHDPAPWMAAVEAWERVGWPLPLAEARLRLGVALLAADRRTEAYAALAAARSTALSLGARPLLRQVDRIARVVRLDLGGEGAAPPAGDTTGDDLGLTPREREVLRLVAAGWTNPEIGEGLGISPKTASVHVSNVLGKLGVGSRVEAAVVAARLGLAPTESAASIGQDDDGVVSGSTRPRARRTFLFTDMVGSTALLQAIGDDAWRDLRRWHDSTLRGLFERHGGREIDHAGDGFFVVFEHAADAVACAAAIQRALAEHRRTAGFAPAVRIGLHSGEADMDGRGYSGAAVHIAARVAARAGSGEVLASEATVREARVATGARLTEVSLPGVAEPVAVAELPW